MLVACILGTIIVFVDSTVVNVALRAIEDDLGGGLALQQWVVDADLDPRPLLLVGGRSATSSERDGVLVGIVGFGITSILCAAAPTGTTLIVARGLQGVLGAVLTPAGLVVIAQRSAVRAWPRDRAGRPGRGSRCDRPARRRLAGRTPAGAGSSGQRAARDRHGVAVADVAPHAPPGRTSARRRSRGCLRAGLGGPVFALIEEPQRGWSDPLIVVSLVGGIILFGLFILWESRAPQPMLPLRLFSKRNFSFANVETFAVYAGLSTLTFFLVLFLQQLAGYTALRSGVALLPITIVMFLLSPRVGRLSMRHGPRWFMGIGPFVAAIALLGLGAGRRPASVRPGAPAQPVLFSVGLSMIVAPLTATVLSDAGESDAGIASGTNNAVARVAGLLGIAVVGAAVAGPQNQLDVAGFHLAMWITSLLVLAGGIIGVAGVRNR